MILRSSELAMIGAIFQLRFVFFSDRCPSLRCGGMVMIKVFCGLVFSGKKPDYLGVQKNERLALCPATNNCISTSESVSDRVHYAPPW